MNNFNHVSWTMKSILLSLVLITSAALAADSLTHKNIEGQKNLFKEGWMIITSPVEAWEEAIKNNESSKEAFHRAIDKIKLNQTSTSEKVSSASDTMREINEKEREITKDLMNRAKRLEQNSFKKSSKNFQEAWRRLSLGYIKYSKTNEEDLKALKEINLQFFGRINSNFKEMEEALEPVMGHLLVKSETSWKKHFKEASYSFNEQYEKSGRQKNSLLGLWDILVGYASWTYNAIVKPSSKATYNSIKSAPFYTVDAILKTFIASFNVVHSLGTNVYYSTKLGYKLLSPSLEAGYLSGLALMNVFNGAVTSNALRTAGIINKVAIKSSAPVLGTSQLVFEEAASRAQDSATILIYGSQALCEVVLEKVETGVVLGYSALSQIPPQLLLTGMNSAIFLVYDGPKLLLAKVSGDLGDMNVNDLPVGTVLDLKKAKEDRLQIVPLTEDPDVIEKVLQHVD